MIPALDDLIERRIREAQKAGQFDGLPGQGQPLQLDEPPLVPDDVRVAWRVLRNAGMVPPEIEALRAPSLDDGRDDQRGDPTGAGARADGADAGDQLDRRVSRRLLAMTMALERQGVTLSGPALAALRKKLYGKLSAPRSSGAPSSIGDGQ